MEPELYFMILWLKSEYLANGEYDKRKITDSFYPYSISKIKSFIAIVIKILVLRSI